MSGNYRRVSQRENHIISTSSSSDSLDANVTRSKSDRCMDKLIGFLWICIAMFVTRWFKFYNTLWTSNELNRNLLHLSFFILLIVISMILYLTVYLPKVKGLIDSSAWNVYCPKIIPLITGLSIISFFIFLRAIWPVYGFLAPFIFGTQFMGFLMILHFIPNAFILSTLLTPSSSSSVPISTTISSSQPY